MRNIDLLFSAKAINKIIVLKVNDQKTICNVTQLHFHKENDKSIECDRILTSD